MQNTLKKPVIIAVDGYSSCGKSTLAKQLATKYHLTYIDTGAMYRAVTLYFIQQGVDLGNNEMIDRILNEIEISFKKDNGSNTTYLNGENVETEIRSMEVSSKVSQVSAISAVRRKMVSLQQKMGSTPGKDQGSTQGVVMDGRDIGTVVFPNADIKFFVTADPITRAQRRHNEITSKGGLVTFEEVFDNVNLRDKIDTERKDSPLKMAPDAILIDNTNLTIEEQFQKASETVDHFLNL